MGCRTAHRVARPRPSDALGWPGGAAVGFATALGAAAGASFPPFPEGAPEWLPFALSALLGLGVYLPYVARVTAPQNTLPLPALARIFGLMGAVPFLLIGAGAFAGVVDLAASETGADFARRLLTPLNLLILVPGVLWPVLSQLRASGPYRVAFGRGSALGAAAIAGLVVAAAISGAPS
ncbi:MAG: hypothetical protein AAFW46_07935 [Pseudomonadota bacterium]